MKLLEISIGVKRLEIKQCGFVHHLKLSLKPKTLILNFI